MYSRLVFDTLFNQLGPSELDLFGRISLVPNCR